MQFFNRVLLFSIFIYYQAVWQAVGSTRTVTSVCHAFKLLSFQGPICHCHCTVKILRGISSRNGVFIIFLINWSGSKSSVYNQWLSSAMRFLYLSIVKNCQPKEAVHCFEQDAMFCCLLQDLGLKFVFVVQPLLQQG